MAARVAIFLNTAWNIHNFRRPLMAALAAAGHDVVAFAPHDAYAGRLPVPFVDIPMAPHGTSPHGDAALTLRIRAALKRERIDVLLNYTIKPNIYGTLAAASAGVAAINNISGLGTVFIKENWVSRVARGLYRVSQPRAHTVFFQNHEDRDEFLYHGLVPADRIRLIPGSGMDPGAFAPRPERAPDGRFRFTMIARLLRDKGVGEFVEAARIIRARDPAVEFQLVGPAGSANKTAYGPQDAARWQAEGVICYAGPTDDVKPVIAAADCIVLPSYREGAPRVLLEAASMARPLITTDVPGCRQVVDDGVNGFLCGVRDGKGLAAAMERMMRLDPACRQAMGQAGRAKVIREYDQSIVHDAYLDAVDRALAARRRGKGAVADP